MVLEPSRLKARLTRVKEHLVAQTDFFVGLALLGVTLVELVDLETLKAAQVWGCGQEYMAVGG